MQSDNFYADSLHCYLKQILKIPSLSPEEVHCYAKQVQQMKHLLELKVDLCTKLSHDPTFAQWSIKARLSESALKLSLQEGKRAKRMLIEANLRLVVAIARRYQNQGVELLDLIQEGTLGLARAVEKFDASRGNQLSTYSYRWIEGKIRRTVENQKKDNSVLQYESTHRLDLVGPEIAPSEATLSQLQQKECLIQVVAELSERQKDVLWLCLGLEDGKKYSRRQTAEKLGLTVRQVRYAYETALETLRAKRLHLLFLHG